MDWSVKERIADNGGWYLAVMSDGDEIAELYNADHARLIAASPDMLAALTECRETLRQVCEGQHPDNVCCHHLRAVDAAIAKAEGMS
jgi:hypothetical protein